MGHVWQDIDFYKQCFTATTMKSEENITEDNDDDNKISVINEDPF